MPKKTVTKKRTRVTPGEEKELADTALESVAGGCQIGCSVNSCVDISSALDPMPTSLTCVSIIAT